jgi:prepilin-type N-terminal cleavage/methylation domain-containing protein
MRQQGFTFIEILITLSLLGLLFVPMMNFFSQAVESTRSSRDMMTAVTLARWHMEQMKNLSADFNQLKPIANTLWPPPEEPALALNERLWRIDRIMDPEHQPTEVRIAVRLDGEVKPLVELTTLLTETSWVQ